jgi:hypothetical protein
MQRRLRLVLAAGTLAMLTGLSTQTAIGAGSSPTPLWVKHVGLYPGGISNGVRAYLDPAVIQAQAQYGRNLPTAPSTSKGSRGPLNNLQMNDDSYPPLPQNETAVAYNLTDPMIAVAGANDYVSGATVVMRTTDGGQNWASTRVIPVFRPFSEICNGGDPAIAYSLRDKAFYLSQLCFFRTESQSEVQIYKSLDNGLTWTPGRRAAIAATNYDSSTGEIDASIFNDKEYLVVDNNPLSLWYGRVYVSYTRFHIADDGTSDTCPIKLSYTDTIPSQDPSLAIWTHTDVVPDDPSGQGLGESANQFSVPVVESSGVLDIAYVIEECNTALDHGLRFQQSSDGGASFLSSAVTVDKAGLWADNPDTSDLIPNTAFRTPNTISLAWSAPTGTLAFIYTNYINGQGDGNIDVSLSTDDGVTWTDPIHVSVNGQGIPAPNNQFFPWIAADQSGRFHAMWLDRRLDPNNHDISTFQGKSTNDGLTWKNRRVSTEAWDPDLGFFKSGAFIGDYSGLAASDQVIYAVWTDGRDSSIEETGIGETDVFTNVEIQG